MATHDQILREIRLDLRQLDLSRRQFEIGRERLITASRQVEQAEYDLRTSTADIPVTLNLLNALTSQLGAKNQLIGSWVAVRDGADEPLSRLRHHGHQCARGLDQ